MLPDKIFTEILSDMFALARDLTIGMHLEGLDPEKWKEELHHASRVFSPETALATVKKLEKANQDESHLWGMNDYHYCLIYDLLWDYCEYKNDVAIVKVDGAEIWEVNFDQLLEIYFPDTDFLFPKEWMEKFSPEFKAGFDLRPETFSMAMGLKPHPDELKLTLCETGKFTPLFPLHTIYRKGSKKYPC